MMTKDAPIALFDSGVGGLTIAKEIIDEFPNEEIIYFGDTAHLPYGPRPQKEVRNFALEIINYFKKLDVKMVIIACNTATAASLEVARKRFSFPIIGPIETGVEAAINKTENNKVGVIATEGTIGSGAYQTALIERLAEVEISAKACSAFVPLVEEGQLYTRETKEVIREHLLPLKEEGVDTLLLGCTHFPYLSRSIKEVVGEDISLIYPGRSIALEVRSVLEEKNLTEGEIVCVFSEERFVEIAKITGEKEILARPESVLQPIRN